MDNTNYLRVGFILRPHGVHGAVKIQSLTDDNSRFKKLSDALIELNGKINPIKVQKTNVQQDDIFVEIEGIDDRNAAEKLRNAYICVDREHAVKLPEGMYFVVDIIGCNVFLSDGVEVGKVQDVLETGANDVYVIKGISSTGTIMIPALKKLLVDVDIEQKKIVLDKDVFEEVALVED